jgi:endogenous inhibitor of DNA gyrase (YacG/DUF329 family)
MAPSPRVKCPTCGTTIDWSPASAWRPFCSERCKLIDLGAWLTEQHAIPGEPVQEDDGGDPDASGRAEGHAPGPFARGPKP